MESVETQNPLAMFKPLELQVPVNRPRFVEGQPFEFGLGNRLIQELGSSIEGSKNPTRQTNTPKFVENVDAKVMEVDKTAKLF
jgi:hypothetical protein